jgi:transcriptional regulator
MPSETIELVQGTLEFLILKTLSRGDPMHGFHLLRWIHDTTEGALSIEEGSLYPALHRMERRKWIEGQWGVSEKGRRAKYYRLTNAGRKQLISQQKHWDNYVTAVGKIVATAEGMA